MSKQTTLFQFFKPKNEKKDQVVSSPSKKPKAPTSNKKLKQPKKKLVGLEKFFVVNSSSSDKTKERRDLLKKQLLEQQEVYMKAQKEKEINSAKAVKMRDIELNSESVGVEISKHIFLGTAPSAANLEWLERKQIYWIINCTPDVLCFFNPKENPNFKLKDFKGIRQRTYLKIPLDDSDDQSIKSYFNEVFDFVENALKQNESVLFHCLLGRSRSASLLIAYLMKKYSIKYADVLDLIDERDWTININAGFQRQLLDYQNVLFKDPVPMRRTRRLLSQQSQGLSDVVKQILKEVKENDSSEEFTEGLANRDYLKGSYGEYNEEE
ncbi:protein-tyrosine-phosphatase [Entamoeba marina]